MLHFPILVNNSPIGNVFIRRQHDLTPDRWSQYTVKVDINDERYEVTVRHCYDDGALVLISKALEAIAQRQVQHPDSRVELLTDALTPAQRNAIIWIGGRDKGSDDYIRQDTQRALEDRGLIQREFGNWNLTEVGDKVYTLVAERLRERIAAAKAAGKDHWSVSARSKW